MRKYSSATRKNIIQIGRRLRQARVEAGFSQPKLARKIGVSHTSVSSYERGLFRIPIDTLMTVAEYLNKPIGFFFGENADYEQQLYKRFEQLFIQENGAKYGKSSVKEILKKAGLSPKAMKKFRNALKRLCKRHDINFNEIW